MYYAPGKPQGVGIEERILSRQQSMIFQIVHLKNSSHQIVHLKNSSKVPEGVLCTVKRVLILYVFFALPTGRKKYQLKWAITFDFVNQF